jgi:non-heme chloroperoxidase
MTGAAMAAPASPGRATIWITTPTSLSALLDALDVREAVLVGHSTGGGEVAHYIGRHGTARLAKAVLVGRCPR